MARNGEFKYVTRVRPDSKGRVTLGRLAEKISSYKVEASPDGRILLEPFAEIPARERWLYENPVALESVKRGLRQSAAGETFSLGALSRQPGKRARRKK
jgi:hypothetical protein